MGQDWLMTGLTRSIRPHLPNPLRLHPPNLPRLGPPVIPRRPRLPRHGAPPRQTKTHPAPNVSDLLPKRPLPSQRICEIRLDVWNPEHDRVCVTVGRDGVLRGGSGGVLAC